MDFRKFLQLGFVAVGITLVASGCSTPQSSRTAGIRDVEIKDALSADNLLVQPGDEVRWVNMRKNEVTVDIPNLKSGDLACERGFSNWLGSLRETAVLSPNQTASLCFQKPAVINYNVRSETALAGGKLIIPGVIKVGTPLRQ